MTPLTDPIGDRGRLVGHLEALAERPGEDEVFREAVTLQYRPGQTAQGDEDLADGGRIEGDQARVVACFRCGIRGRGGPAAPGEDQNE